MATERNVPLVAAAPVSTFVQPQAAAVELYNQQTVNLALEMSEAFSNLSITAARVAGQLKEQNNEEQVQQGIDLVNNSQKTYMDLVRSGQIAPAANPWMALGAQKASGTIEGMRARAQFDLLYENKSQQDPKFFESMDGFDALSANFISNYVRTTGDSEYLRRSFFEAFNPYVAAMGERHVAAIGKKREERVQIGIAASVAQAVDDGRIAAMSGKAGIDGPLEALQQAIDQQIANGFSAETVNRAAIDNLLEVQKSSDNPEIAAALLERLRTPYGRLADTAYAKARSMATSGDRLKNSERLTRQKNDDFNTWLGPALESAIAKNQDANSVVADYAIRARNLGLSVSPNEENARRAYIVSQYKAKQAEAQAAAIQKMDDAFQSSMDNIVTKTRPEWVSDPVTGEAAAKDHIYQVIDAMVGATPEQRSRMRLQATSKIEEHFNGIRRDRNIKTYEGLHQMTRTLAVAPPELGESPEQAAARNRKGAIQAIETSDLDSTQKRALIDGYDKMYNDHAEERQLNAFSSQWEAQGRAVDQAYGQQLMEFMSIPKGPDGSPMPNAGGEIPDTEQIRRSMNDFLTARGLDMKTGQGKQLALAQYERLKGMVDTQFDAIVQMDRTLNGSLMPTPNDTPQAMKVKEELRTRKMALRLQLASTFEDSEPTGQMIRQFGRLLNTMAAENPSEEDLMVATDTLRAFTYIRDNMDLKAILPDGQVGRAFEETIQLAMAYRAQGRDIANIVADVTSAKRMGQTYQINFMQVNNPLYYLDEALGLPTQETDEAKRNILATREQAEVTNPDAQLYLIGEWSRVFQDRLAKTGKVAASMNAAKDAIGNSKEYFTIRGSLVPRAPFSRQSTAVVSGKVRVSDDASMERWLVENVDKYPEYRDRMVTPVVVGVAADGMPLFSLTDKDGYRVRLPNLKPVMTPNDFLLDVSSLAP